MGNWNRSIWEVLKNFLNADGTAIKTETNLRVADIEIGAVEIKDATTDTRAVVGSNGLYVDVRNAKSNDTLVQGNVTMDGTAKQLHANTACKVVTVQAHPDNAGYVYVGKSDVSSSVHMAILAAGTSMTFTVSNVNTLYALGGTGDKICYGGEV